MNQETRWGCDIDSRRCCRKCRETPQVQLLTQELAVCLAELANQRQLFPRAASVLDGLTTARHSAAALLAAVPPAANALRREAAPKEHCGLLGDPNVEETLGKLLGEQVGAGTARHCSRDRDHLRVGLVNPAQPRLLRRPGSR